MSVDPFVVSIPRLETPRLRLREYRASDFDAYAAYVADPEATKFIDGADRALAWRMFGSMTAGWLLHGAGWWMVEERASGLVVGNVGAFFRDGCPTIEVGWSTYRAHWRRGFAVEAVTEVLRYAREDRGEHEVVAHIDAANLPSLGVAARVGLRYDRDVPLKGMIVGRYTNR